MKPPPEQISRFLSSKTVAVVGVSRDNRQAANLVFNRLRTHGYEVYPVNPNAETIDGIQCYPDIPSLPRKAEAVMIMTHPDKSAEIVRQCGAAGISRVWLHRSFGQGSVSDEAVRDGKKSGVECITGGCPMMFLEPVDLAHRCFRWILKMQKRIPG
jgi:predicted CoA-binding protein